ncbi:MAG: acyl-CoA dehydrogenase family protein, partial [Firmicutes bacterium]|nr:acyl-CoA dehydrogenase family protein [Bacillota bacterium]
MLADTVYKFMLREVAPITERIDREDYFPLDVWKKIGALGLMGLTVPEEYGGGGQDLLATVLVMEQMSRICPAVALSYGAHAVLCTDTLYHNANEEQRRRYLPGLCSGEKIGCLALTEPNAGSDAVSIQTTARREGDHYLLNGTKMFITNAPVGHVFVVYAKTDKAAGARGISAFIVERDFPGLSVPRKLEKMGHRGSPTGEVVFEDCRVPAANLLGQENRGVAVMMSGLDRERAAVAAIPVGLAQGTLDLALKYAKERVQFGQPIASFQLIQAKLADMYTQIEAARLLTYKAAILADRSERGGKGTEIHKVAAAAILFAGEMATRVALEALQIHGGYGYMLEYPVNRYVRDAKLLEIGAGTSEIRRLVIARELL